DLDGLPQPAHLSDRRPPIHAGHRTAATLQHPRRCLAAADGRLAADERAYHRAVLLRAEDLHRGCLDRWSERMTDIDSLLLVPLDERPINAAYPHLLAAALGWRLDTPASSLGSRKVPADSAAVAEWLWASAGQGAAGAVVALDTLAWGGLIPSRQSGADLQAALGHLEVLRRLRSRHPRLPLLAFSSIQRVSRDDDDAEEPDYYRQHGRAIFRRSVLEHRSQVTTLGADEADELAALRRSIPPSVWEDQLAIRQRTLAVNLAALDLVADGVIDTLVLNQD